MRTAASRRQQAALLIVNTDPDPHSDLKMAIASDRTAGLFSSSIASFGEEQGSTLRPDSGPVRGPKFTSQFGKGYDYTLKFLLVGDSDVGKEEIMNGLEQEEEHVEETSFCESPGVSHKWTVILLDGKRVRIQLWDTSGQGRFSTIIRSYSRGAQGILLVYDITNKWSFSGLNRWLLEVEEHAPGVPMILLGNRLHLAFKRQVSEHGAEAYAHKHNMSFFEVSPLCNFNVRESFAELARVVLQRHGMDCLWRHCVVPSLQELSCRAIVRQTTSYGIEQLPLPASIKSCLKSFSTHSASPSGLTIKPCFSIYDRNAAALRDRDKDNTLRRKAKALFACDASSMTSTAGLSRSRPTSRSTSRPSESDTVMGRSGRRLKNCIIS